MNGNGVIIHNIETGRYHVIFLCLHGNLKLCHAAWPAALRPLTYYRWIYQTASPPLPPPPSSWLMIIDMKEDFSSEITKHIYWNYCFTYITVSGDNCILKLCCDMNLTFLLCLTLLISGACQQTLNVGLVGFLSLTPAGFLNPTPIGFLNPTPIGF